MIGDAYRYISRFCFIEIRIHIRITINQQKEKAEKVSKNYKVLL